MFPSSGYFRGVTCPYFASGLCERPYCHFRHVKSEENTGADGTAFQRLATNEDVACTSALSASGSQPPHKAGSSLLSVVGDAIKKVQQDIERDKARLHNLKGEDTKGSKPRNTNVKEVKTGAVPSYKPTPITAKNKYPAVNLKESVQREALQEYEPTPAQPQKELARLPHGSKKSSVPQYNPTPIKLLQQKTKDHQKYQPETDMDESSMEYDPSSNYLTSKTKAGANYGLKRTADAQNEPVSKRRRTESSDVEGVFSSDEEEDGMTIDINEDISNDKGDSENKMSSVQKDCKKDQLGKGSGVNGNKKNSDSVISKEENIFSKLSSENQLKNNQQKRDSLLNGFLKGTQKEEDNLNVTEDSAPCVQSESKIGKSKENDNAEKFEMDKVKSEETASGNLSSVVDFRSQNDKKDRTSAGNSNTSSQNGNSVHDSKSQRHVASSSHSSSKEKSGHRHHSSKSSSSSNKSSSSSSKSNSSNSKSSSSSHKLNSLSKSGSSHHSSKEKHHRTSSSRTSSDRQSSDNKHKHHSSSESNHHKFSKNKSTSDKKESTRSSSSTPSSHKHDKQSKSSSDAKTKDSGSRPCKDTSKNKKPAFNRGVSHVDLFGEDSDDNEFVLSPEKSSKSKGVDDITFSSDSDNDTALQIDQGSNDEVLLDMDVDLSDGDTYEECLGIFKEESTTQSKKEHNKPELKKMTVEEEEDEEMALGKKRTAHKELSEVEKKKRITERIHAQYRPSPAQVMHNRFLEMQRRAQEQARQATISQQPSTSTTSGGKNRMAHNLKLSVDKKPNNVKGSVKSDASKEPTRVGTTDKGGKRTAHTATVNVAKLKRPTIPTEFGGKVPTNVRQQYLNRIIDECLKLYPSEEDAYERGLSEEKAVYERSSSKTVYLNVAVNAIKKLRSEGACKSPVSNAKNLVSHQAVLGGAKAANCTFTLNRCGKLDKMPDTFTGADLFKRLEPYVLTEEQLVDNGFPRSNPDVEGSSVVIKLDERKLKTMGKSSNPTEKVCCRCGKRFNVTHTGVYLTNEECVFHWGKCWKRKVAGSIENRYTCCQGDLSTKGCEICKNHVYESNRYQDLKGYMTTLPSSPPIDGDYGVYALDCEMVYTTGGSELARITVVGPDLKPVYEKLVKPDFPVIDYNTRFSGLTEEEMEDVETNLRDVQAVLLSLFTDRTILIGHSLESDLISLKLLHSTVVDTSVSFPHRLGPPYKRALRTLMAEYLQRIIQEDVGGHDSQEDAAACMELMMWKLKQDAKKAFRRN